MPSKRQTKEWSIDEKIRILAKAAKLTGSELTELLEREGLLLAEYEQWRLALAEEGRASLATTKRIRVHSSAIPVPFTATIRIVDSLAIRTYFRAAVDAAR